jgi:hypothetical protein
MLGFFAALRADIGAPFGPRVERTPRWGSPGAEVDVWDAVEAALAGRRGVEPFAVGVSFPAAAESRGGFLGVVFDAMAIGCMGSNGMKQMGAVA